MKKIKTIALGFAAGVLLTVQMPAITFAAAGQQIVNAAQSALRYIENQQQPDGSISPSTDQAAVAVVVAAGCGTTTTTISSESCDAPSASCASTPSSCAAGTGCW